MNRANGFGMGPPLNDKVWVSIQLRYYGGLLSKPWLSFNIQRQALSSLLHNRLPEYCPLISQKKLKFEYKIILSLHLPLDAKKNGWTFF